MAPDIKNQGGNFLLVYHTCEPEGTKILTRFKSDFYQVPDDQHPDNPRVKVRIPKVGGTYEDGWRCGVRDCEKCKKTAGTLTSLTVPVAISHGITGVPVQEQSGQILGLLAVRGLRHRHEGIFAEPAQARGLNKGAPSPTPSRTYISYQAPTGVRGPHGDFDSSRFLPHLSQQVSNWPSPIAQDHIAERKATKLIPATKKKASTRSSKHVTFAKDTEESLFVSEDDEEYAVTTKKKSAARTRRSLNEGANESEDGTSPQASSRPKRKAKDAATASLRQTPFEDLSQDQTQEVDEEESAERVVKRKKKETRAERKAREQREMDMLLSWERGE